MYSNCTVYTTLFGDYEALGNPFGDFPPLSRRVCFTDNPNLRSDSWEIRVVKTQGLDPARESRRYKLQPEKYLPGSDWSLYVDNSVRFSQPPEKLFEYVGNNGGTFYCFAHPWRDCVYREAEAVIMGEKDAEPRVREQIDAYRQAAYPEKAGLYAGTVLVRKHGTANLAELGELWFEHVLRYSRRDQISLPFAARSVGATLTTLPGELHNNEFIHWAKDKIKRVPAGFSPEVYRWLNPEADRPELSAEAHYLAHANSRTRYKRFFSSLNSLANKYRSDKGDLYYNAHGYARVYEQYLRSARTRPLRVLEIGLLRHDVQRRQTPPYSSAPSLSMWREFLPKAEIFGFDIADFSAVPPLPGVSILRGDASSKKDLVELLKKSGGKFDMIIDDASHASHHQQVCLSVLYGSLTPGGIYVIEDLSFQPREIEIPGLVKTKAIIRGLQCGEIMPTDYVSAKSLQYILDTADEISLYDSRDSLTPKVDNDALAVIRKGR